MRKFSGLLVTLGLIFLFVAAVTYVIRFGARYPYSDDWNLIAYLVKSPIDLGWLWEPHGEHRIPLPKLIQWLSFRVTGDYRTPSLIVAVLFGLLMVFTLVVSVRTRGRISVVDLLPPLAYFHFAQGFLHWGFHVQFGSSTFLISLLVIWFAYRIHSHQELWEACDLMALLFILFALVASGTNGLVPALVISAYFLPRVAFQVRDLNPPPRVATLTIITGLVIACVLSSTILVGIPQESPFRAQGVRDVIQVAFRVAISPLGALVMDTRDSIAVAVAGLSSVLFAFAFFYAIKPLLYYVSSCASTAASNKKAVTFHQIASKVDFLLLGFAIITLVCAIGVGRGGRGWEPGLEMHYGVAAVPLVLWSYLTFVIHSRDRFARLAIFILASLFIWTYLASIPLANRISKLQGERRVAFEKDLKAGKPMGEIIGKHIAFLFWVDIPYARNSVREGLQLLRAEAVRDNHRRAALQPYLSMSDGPSP